VIDTADGTPRIVYHRDLTRLGWPLGRLDNDVSKENRLTAKK